MRTPSATAEHSAEWERLVGKAILRFGDIEFVSIRLLATAQSRDLKEVAPQKFAVRVDQLIKLLKSRNSLSNCESELLLAFEEAKGLARKRNLIAHNPMRLDIYVNREETEMCVDRSIRSMRNDGEILDIAALKEFAGTVDDLAAFVWLNYCNAVGSSSDLWRMHHSDDHNGET